MENLYYVFIFIISLYSVMVASYFFHREFNKSVMAILTYVIITFIADIIYILINIFSPISNINIVITHLVFLIICCIMSFLELNEKN